MLTQNSQIIILDITDSTNNYAMRLIEAGKATHGMTITANSQTQGKGQRGKTWTDAPGNSLLMSVIVCPKHDLSEQFLFNASITQAIANVLQKICKIVPVHIKWPNDIIIHDKKAGGILIENVIRGNNWTYSVIGLGLNVLQSNFPDSLPFATSLKMATGMDIAMATLCDDIQQNIVHAVAHPQTSSAVMAKYNEMLYKQGQQQKFSTQDREWQATIIKVGEDGLLDVCEEDGAKIKYQHGSVVWVY